MNNIDITTLLNRNNEEKMLIDLIETFDYKNTTSKKGIYIYGNSGSGKTNFVLNILKKYNYDVILYNACDIRNKAVIETVTKDNITNTNVLNLFHKNIKKPIIVMDEIDSMINGGDKGGLTSLIKLIRPKKMKKTKTEILQQSFHPIICIGNYNNDKKINELMKVCHIIELITPSNTQINRILDTLIPELNEQYNINSELEIQQLQSQKSKDIIKSDIIEYIQGDLKKINIIHDLYKKNPSIVTSNLIKNILQKKINNDNIKNITQNLLNQHYSLETHSTVMNETDRTIIGLLWHENIVDVLDKIEDKKVSVPLYLEILKNISFSDYIDRITFQKQIWQFNEMTSFIKTFKNNKLYHEKCKENGYNIKYNPKEVRFTKVLTKYSTQYNNECFIQHLCQQLLCDKKDMIQFFTDLKEKYTSISEFIHMFENYEITKLDINRIFRYLEKSITDTKLKDDEFLENENDDGYECENYDE